jgi:hypothetical protein
MVELLIRIEGTASGSTPKARRIRPASVQGIMRAGRATTMEPARSMNLNLFPSRIG